MKDRDIRVSKCCRFFLRTIVIWAEISRAIRGKSTQNLLLISMIWILSGTRRPWLLARSLSNKRISRICRRFPTLWRCTWTRITCSSKDTVLCGVRSRTRRTRWWTQTRTCFRTGTLTSENPLIFWMRVRKALTVQISSSPSRTSTLPQ